jgi:hypothetical protein
LEATKHGYDLEQLKSGLVTKGRWNDGMEVRIRETGGLTKDEVKDLRQHLKTLFPGASLTLGNLKYNPDYKSLYNKIGELGKKYLANIKASDGERNLVKNDRYRRFGRGAPPGRGGVSFRLQQ